MYVILTGAKGNVGDFLIRDRAKKLLRAHRAEHQLVELDRWNGVEEYLECINRADAVILCGGPAYQRHLYPGVYPLVNNLDEIQVPIIAFALGWKGRFSPEQSLSCYKFTARSMHLLRRIHNNSRISSCRDYITKMILELHGFDNVVMTGDPAWYDLDSIDLNFQQPQNIKTIVFSTPAQAAFFSQSVSILKGLRKMFGNANIVCAFHHGWGEEENLLIPDASVREYQKLKDICTNNGFKSISLAANLDLFQSIYEHADLHIGYRLHGHLFRLSRKKPSFLIEEDGRCSAASEALGLKGIKAWDNKISIALVSSSPLRRLSPVGEMIRRMSLARFTVRAAAKLELLRFVREELDNGFVRFEGLSKMFERCYRESMIPFLKSLP